MSQDNNTTTVTRTDLERVWAEQRRPDFVAPHETRHGGPACFNSGVGFVSRAMIAAYDHPANSTVGAYPSMNEASCHCFLHLEKETDGTLDHESDAAWVCTPRGTAV